MDIWECQSVEGNPTIFGVLDFLLVSQSQAFLNSYGIDEIGLFTRIRCCVLDFSSHKI